jgi:hypothetical protein
MCDCCGMPLDDTAIKTDHLPVFHCCDECKKSRSKAHSEYCNNRFNQLRKPEDGFPDPSACPEWQKIMDHILVEKDRELQLFFAKLYARKCLVIFYDGDCHAKVIYVGKEDGKLRAIVDKMYCYEDKNCTVGMMYDDCPGYKKACFVRDIIEYCDDWQEILKFILPFWSRYHDAEIDFDLDKIFSDK